MQNTTASSSPCRVGIVGATGRMGRMLIEAACADPRLTLAAVFENSGHPRLGQGIDQLVAEAPPLLLSDNPAAGFADCDVIIDFTRPEATLNHLAICEQLGTALVIGTTGFTRDQKNRIGEAAKSLAIVMSPNMALGVNALFRLLAVAAELLPRSYDVEIVEAHHRHKVDAPSGTALRLGEIVATARGQSLADQAVYTRQGHTGERPDAAIGFSAIRGGDIIGDHTVLFCGEGERIEITHRSASRAAYARGSLEAALFVHGQKPGIYDMQAVIGAARS